jgi:hypothetical protein
VEKPDSGGTTCVYEGKMGVWMKPAVSAVLLGISALALAGCGSTMRNYLEKDTPAQSTAMRTDLTMPPDLRLPQPGTTAPAPDPGAALGNEAALTVPQRVATAPSTAAPAAPPPMAGATPADSVYTQAGISLTKPDGTRKSDAELREELQAYYMAQKKAKNPKYGTVFNIGNIFKDE